MIKKTAWITALVIAGLAGGCHDKQPAIDAQPVHKHEHKPLHGGTAIELGKEEYHLELVLDASLGKMQAYVMDGELENFIRITSASFEVTAKLPGKEETLTFQAVANSATGEKTGDTSFFEAQADWLKTTRQFDAVLKQIEIRGRKYETVAFNFPKGNDAAEKANQ